MEDNKNHIIKISVKDSFINDFPSVIAKIVDTAHKNEKIVLIMPGAGCAVEKLTDKDKKFLDILADLCNSNSWPKNKFELWTENLIQDQTVWPNIKYRSNLDSSKSNSEAFLEGQHLRYKNKNKNFLYHFGCLINGSTWNRLWISAFIHQHFSDKTFQTFRRKLDNPSHTINLDIDRLFFYFSQHQRLTKESITCLGNFLSQLPIEKHKDLKKTEIDYFSWDNGGYDVECLEWYDNFFLDIVCETFFSGRTFYLTEKIARPILTCSPFLVFGPANFLKNLKKIGFKTFSNFWDETYDDFEGVMRIDAMEKVLYKLSLYSLQDLKLLYDKIKPVLDHNYSLYQSLNGDHIMKIFFKE